MQVITLTLNPCVDRTLWVHEFGDTPHAIEHQAGGKGLNVVRVLAAMGVDCAAVFPAGGESGKLLLSLAGDEGICAHASATKAPTRIIDSYVRATDFAQKVDYAQGDALTEDELDALEETLFALLPSTQILAICGSASCTAAAMRVPGIIRRARDLGVAVLLDSNGEALQEGVKACPDLLKPNQAELAALLGRDVPFGDEAEACMALIEKGIGGVIVSLGSAGCCYVREGLQTYCPAPKIKTINAVGSGDSFVAGFLYGAINNYSESTAALAIACAAGAANAAMFPAARIGKEEINALLGFSI